MHSENTLNEIPEVNRAILDLKIEKIYATLTQFSPQKYQITSYLY
ncbi:hypothetical protein [Xanthocytophaga flava]|nr:hypothetical protein [Xanthocytophaga flavus]MDJ1471011.1 hypothetical protein [Xanthocytophaga flavus]